MALADYQRIIEVPVTAGEAFEKISRVPEWWISDFKGSAQRVGDAFTVRFGETWVDFKIAEAVPGKRVVWQVTNCNLPWLKDKTEWTGTRVVWEISSSNGTASVSMTHEGLVPGIECYDSCEKGWDFYVTKSLLQFLTSGKGLPEGEGKEADSTSAS
jgi:hypothetical protein